MIPSLVVSEIRSALVEYLASTFALSDEKVREALSTFLEDNAEGIFRGPYLSVRTPFQQVEADWQSPLDWVPDGFVPYQHQATAFERLASGDGRTPSPTLVTTGTGSGKTECFLYPILDHCARERAEGKRGIKALILYPMNALASDQAGRIAGLIAGDRRLAGVTAGIYVGEEGRHGSMGAENLIDKRDVLRAQPPDILLTNYKMLDFLLLRHDDRDLWAVNEADTLKFVVLDEFHTYDGAQGTDVAMLLRRLGSTLRMATDDAPLGSATPVATSATLGSGAEALDELRDFAEKVFGTPFGADSIVGETRQTVEEACGKINFGLPIPNVNDLSGLTDFEDVAAAFCIDPDEPEPIDGVVELGNRLIEHPLTRVILTTVGGRPRSWTDAVAEIVSFDTNWERSLMTGHGSTVEEALAQYLRLLSMGRRRQGEHLRPLFSVEVQLWIREVSRLLRRVSGDPSFRWRDSAAAVDEDQPPPEPGSELPAIYCRRCGMSGWMVLASETSEALNVKPATIYAAALAQSPLVRALMHAHPDDADVVWFSPAQRRLVKAAGDDAVPVLHTPNEDDAKANRCPGCNERDAIRFLGLAVASLASVSINTLFASPSLEENERKLLAFTDSVQDASHRAAFFGGRTHRINLRSLMARIIRRHGSVALADLGYLLLVEADSPRDRFGLVPPDLLRHALIRTVWSDDPAPGALELLEARLAFEADLEFGLRARVGRTLELSRVASARVRVDDLDELAGLIAEEAERLSGDRPDALATSEYLRGLAERVRLRGGLVNPLLDSFIDSGGKQWFLWGGRPEGLPPFTPDQGRPSFFTTAQAGDLDSLTSSARNTPTWVVDWARRTLGVDATLGRKLNLWAFNLLAKETDTVVLKSSRSGSIFGLDRAAVQVVDVEDEDDHTAATSLVRCDICGHLHATAPPDIDSWIGSACLRYRCVGHFSPAPPVGAQYYRSLYRSGVTRRVVTAEHTGLLGRSRREDLERAFKDGTAPDAPNVITATPTLEMGIDIGDLSAVMLTSVPRNPASYIQRVGRAGRSSGNSLVTTFVRTDSHGLYYLAEPEAMLAGDVRPPNCYLDAVEILQRQYVAYLLDRAADQTIEAPVPPRNVGALMKSGLDAGGFLKAIIDASTLDRTHSEQFIGLFGGRLSPSTVDKIESFASSGVGKSIKSAVEAWNQQRRDLDLRRGRLTDAIDRITANGQSGPEQESELGSVLGQRAAVLQLIRDHRDDYWISALGRLGILPNYSLIDDGITLSATMWSRNDDGGYETEIVDYVRSGRLAIREFAPGNSFYAGGHRHTVDALEIGTAREPLYETWRLCPDCGYATIEPKDEPPTVCPRCASQAIADTGAKHLMLRLRKALASGSEESARVFDESDDRRRERYEIISAIDVEPSSIEGAWMLQARAFGTEFAGRMSLRTINVGFAERSGQTIPIAGQSRRVTRFTVCAHCGAVADVRNDRDGTQPERLHQGWCKVRSGAVKAKPDPIVLLHELTTEAVRLLLPVSMFEVDERLASFKGALLLGLREVYGGDLDHLEVALSDMPNRSGQGRRRFVVLFDRVPGGTGYLGRLADPGQMQRVLDSARGVIARCVCTTEGRQACHRCLLGVVDRNEYDLVRRDLAIGILDDLLENWEPESVDTVGNADIGKVEESELERRFKVALRDWAHALPDENVSWQPVPGQGRYGAFELRLNHGGVKTRYRIDEQEGLATSPSTVPDYLIRRMDDKGPDVAVYLDGYQFHASNEHLNLAADAQKRRAVRNQNKLVWNLVWDDVEAFHKAFEDDPPRSPTMKSVLTGRARAAAQLLQHETKGLYDVDALNQNPMALLLDYLARPDSDEWRRLALSAVGGLASDAPWKRSVGQPAVEALLRDGIAGVEPNLGDAENAVVSAHRAITSNDLPLTFILDTRDGRANEERWTVIASLDDSMRGDEDVHRRRWKDWLQWSNILQFVEVPGSDVVLAAASEAESMAIEDLWLADLTRAEASSADDPFDMSPVMVEELELVVDEDVRSIVKVVLKQGAADFVAGAERNGEPLEVAWVDLKVAVLQSDKAGFTDEGWDARSVTEWTSSELLRVLQERS